MHAYLYLLSRCREQCTAAAAAELQQPNAIGGTAPRARTAGVCLEPPRIVLEFYPKGSLFDIIERAREGADPGCMSHLKWMDRLSMLHQIAAGMAFLHSRCAAPRGAPMRSCVPACVRACVGSGQPQLQLCRPILHVGHLAPRPRCIAHAGPRAWDQFGPCSPQAVVRTAICTSVSTAQYPPAYLLPAATACRSYVHGDLRSPNVFVALDGHAKVGDFGFAQLLGRSRRDGWLAARETLASPPPPRQLCDVSVLKRREAPGSHCRRLWCALSTFSHSSRTWPGTSPAQRRRRRCCCCCCC